MKKKNAEANIWCEHILSRYYTEFNHAMAISLQSDRTNKISTLKILFHLHHQQRHQQQHHRSETNAFGIFFSSWYSKNEMRVKCMKGKKRNFYHIFTYCFNLSMFITLRLVGIFSHGLYNDYHKLFSFGSLVIFHLGYMVFVISLFFGFQWSANIYFGNDWIAWFRNMPFGHTNSRNRRKTKCPSLLIQIGFWFLFFMTFHVRSRVHRWNLTNSADGNAMILGRHYKQPLNVSFDILPLNMVFGLEFITYAYHSYETF